MNFVTRPDLRQKRHLLIAGTGRAGTSFLVRYLDALGLETHFSSHDEAFWCEDSNAGAEDIPLSIVSGALPYVIKSPWSSEFIDQLLTDDAIKLDAVIVPIRELADAASSRLITESRFMLEAAPWTAKLDQPYGTWGHMPGGVVFSLHPLDQERILAHGFHKLIHRLVRADIPLILIEFPRHVQDAEYLHAKLAPILPDSITMEMSLAAHKKIADPTKVRVDREIVGKSSDESISRAALSREITRLREEIKRIQDSEITRLREEIRRIQESKAVRAVRLVARLARCCHLIA